MEGCSAGWGVVVGVRGRDKAQPPNFWIFECGAKIGAGRKLKIRFDVLSKQRCLVVSQCLSSTELGLFALCPFFSGILLITFDFLDRQLFCPLSIYDTSSWHGAVKLCQDCEW